MFKRRQIAFLLFCLLLTSCSRAALQKPADAMRPSSRLNIHDDLDMQTLIVALQAQIKSLNSQSKTLVFGPRTISSQDYASALEAILKVWQETSNPSKVLEYIQSNFDFLEVYGQDNWEDVLITSYFAPEIFGSLKPTEKYSQALYKKPSDLISLDLNDFDAKFVNERNLRGRLDKNRLVPYYSREDIDLKNALSGKGLEVCWVDPIDAFFLHIQGSGTVKLDNGKELKLNYAEKNGQQYKALGNFLKEHIPLSEMSMDRIESFLKTLTRQEMYDYFKLNPSYVFFTVSDKSSTTSSGIPATDGRTIASDKRFFPSGGLAYLEFDLPEEFKTRNAKKVQRLVLDQDSGGAILGGGRVDLFWGRGDQAKYAAGRIKQKGKIYYLFPKNL